MYPLQYSDHSDCSHNQTGKHFQPTGKKRKKPKRSELSQHTAKRQLKLILLFAEVTDFYFILNEISVWPFTSKWKKRTGHLSTPLDWGGVPYRDKKMPSYSVFNRQRNHSKLSCDWTSSGEHPGGQ